MRVSASDAAWRNWWQFEAAARRARHVSSNAHVCCDICDQKRWSKTQSSLGEQSGKENGRGRLGRGARCVVSLCYCTTFVSPRSHKSRAVANQNKKQKFQFDTWICIHLSVYNEFLLTAFRFFKNFVIISVFYSFFVKYYVILFVFAFFFFFFFLFLLRVVVAFSMHQNHLTFLLCTTSSRAQSSLVAPTTIFRLGSAKLQRPNLTCASCRRTAIQRNSTKSCRAVDK